VNPHSLLIIDDNEDDVLLFRRAASRAGLTNPIVWMADAREALDKLIAAPEFRRVLIVLDLNMPGLSGVEFLRLLRASEGVAHIPVVVLTGSDAQRDIDSCYAAGASSFIRKPLTLDRLAAAVGQLRDYWFNLSFLPS